MRFLQNRLQAKTQRPQFLRLEGTLRLPENLNCIGDRVLVVRMHIAIQEAAKRLIAVLASERGAQPQHLRECGRNVADERKGNELGGLGVRR